MTTANTPNLSYWELAQYFSDLDLVIVGSGIVGLNAAIYAKTLDPHLRVLVLERGPLPSGASTRNAGFACFGSPSELLEDLKTHSEKEVFDLVEQRWKGLKKLRQLLGDQQIGYQELGGYELFQERDAHTYQQCQDQLTYLNQQLAAITGHSSVYKNANDQLATFGFSEVSGLMVNHAEGQIDTGKMMKALIAKARELGVEIINGIGLSSFRSVAGGVEMILSNQWEIRAAKLLLATNGFIKELLPDLQVIPARNQVLITQPIPNLKIKGCFHYDRGYYYFRNIDSRILFGGGRNLASQEEQTNLFGTTSLIQEELSRLLREMICPGQEVVIDRWWSGILGIGQAKTPIVEQVAPGVVVAARMGGMGIAIGSLVGEQGARKVLSES